MGSKGLAEEAGPTFYWVSACWRLDSWWGVRVVAVSEVVGRVKSFVFCLFRMMPMGDPSCWKVSINVPCQVVGSQEGESIIKICVCSAL
jgi:hypothetical protein